MKVEREGNDFDATICIQREHKERGLFVCNSVYSARFSMRAAEQEGGEGLIINNDGQHIPIIKDCVSKHPKQKEIDN